MIVEAVTRLPQIYGSLGDWAPPCQVSHRTFNPNSDPRPFACP